MTAAEGVTIEPGEPTRAGSPTPSPLRGRRVLVAGAGVSGLSAARYLLRHGSLVSIADDRAVLPEDLSEVPVHRGLTEPPAGTDLVVVSPGWRPGTPLLVAAAACGVEVIGDVELAWRHDLAARTGSDLRPWLAVTGTNGKTTTIGMVESILQAAGRRAVASGNVGTGVLDVIDAEPAHDVIAAELSSFQLHWAPTLRPYAGLLLNLAEDHLDWHGGMAAYTAAKARALSGGTAIAVVDDRAAAAVLAGSPAARRIAVTGHDPAALAEHWDGALGVRDGMLVDDAYGAGALLPTDEIRPAGSHNVTNALAAAALTLAVGVTGAEVAAGLRAYTPGGHRNAAVARYRGVRFVDDSKATNPHAARASLRDYPSVVWVIGGQLKGASIDELILDVASRLRAAIVIGVDRDVIDAALARHAPDVPRLVITGTDDGVMNQVVDAAGEFAVAGDVVLLAPAAASLDMFSSYAARGQAFADAVHRWGTADADRPERVGPE
ncbi:UDP-N-acetylmuramoyl-L-alanine--D-glutamate ligase [Nakamurella silvestris]|nr:UDP-N-acetylmuramoyl-L-alanine--D-glutamate ligase [Nakamurella silvestris]